MARVPDTDEAAAIAAAIERFLAESGAGGEREEATTSAWRRAALLEGVSAKATAVQDPKGELKWLS